MSSVNWSRDLVDVFETWRLPRFGEPGRHVICIENETLLDEPWKSERFPLAVLVYQDPLLGWYGSGIGDILEGLQIEINELLDKVRRNMRLLAVPYILKHVGSKVNDKQLLSNDEARLVEWDGTVPPTIETPPAMNAQVFEQLERLVQRSYEMVGISQLSASAVKPTGLSSGVALRAFHDIETQRFSQLARQWENLFVDLAWMVLDAARESGERVRWAGPAGYEDLSLADIGASADAFEIAVMPASGLPQSPAGRLEKVVEMANSGMVDPIEARRLLGMPDLEKEDALASAPIVDLQRAFEHMLRSGEYLAPSEMQDLQRGLPMANSYWLRARLNGEDEDKLDLIARWMAEAQDMVAPGMPPAMPIEPQTGGAETPLEPPAPELPPGMPVGGNP